MDPENDVGRCLRLQQQTSVPGWSGLPDNLCEDCPTNLATHIRYPRAAKKLKLQLQIVTAVHQLLDLDKYKQVNYCLLFQDFTIRWEYSASHMLSAV
jgi:hypothetical protein